MEKQLNPGDQLKWGQDKDPYSARSTLFWQILAGLLCLGAGGGLLSLMTLWANQLEFYDSDRNISMFFLGTRCGGIGLLILTGYITKRQFDEALTPGDIFRVSIYTALWGWVGLTAILLLITLLLGGKFLIIFPEIAFLFISLVMFGAIIGAIQYFRLKLEGFDQVRHRQRLTKQADLAACKAGVLPYQARVRAFWPVMVIALVCLLFIAGGFVVRPPNKVEKRNLLVSIGVILGLAEVAIILRLKTSFTNITSVEGPVSKKKSDSSSKGPINYYLICNNQKFRTEAESWEEIFEGSEYRLWYSPTNMIVVASELLGHKPKQSGSRWQFDKQWRSKDTDTYTYIEQNRRKFIQEAFQRGFQGPVPRTESKMGRRLPDESSLSNNLVYSFEIPALDQIQALSFTVPAELNKASIRVLENQAKIDELVQRLTSRLSKLSGNKKSNQMRAITDKWPALVMSGGEIIASLVAAAEQSKDIITQLLISQLLGDIARDTSARLSQQASNFFCQCCFSRCTAHDIKISWNTDFPQLSRTLTYYGCRICGQSRKVLLHTGPVVAVLDERMEAPYIQAEVLKVNWLIQKNVFDFDKVEIMRANDEAVERFAVQVGNDTDEVRRPRYRRIPCTVSAGCGLSANSIRVLQRVLGEVSIE